MTDETKDRAKDAPSKSKRGLVIAVIVLVAIIVIAAVAYNMLAPTVTAPSTMTVNSSPASGVTGETANSSNEASSTSEEKSDAPDFMMTTVNGDQVELSSLEGKPVVLNFWASTCGPCQREMPEFQEAFEQYGDEVSFVMLNVPDFNGETRDRAMQFISQNGYDFPVYFDDSNEASILYGVSSIPRTFFISADGKMQAYVAGTIDRSVLEQGIGMIL